MSSSGFLCNICNKIYTKNVYLHKHVGREHPSADIPPLRRAGRKSVLAPGEGISCTFCGKLYARRSGARKHEKKEHSQTAGEDLSSHQTKRDTCGFCNKSYYRNSYLRRHIRQKHPGEPLPDDKRSSRFQKTKLNRQELQFQSLDGLSIKLY